MQKLIQILIHDISLSILGNMSIYVKNINSGWDISVLFANGTICTLDYMFTSTLIETIIGKFGVLIPLCFSTGRSDTVKDILHHPIYDLLMQNHI